MARLTYQRTQEVPSFYFSSSTSASEVPLTLGSDRVWHGAGVAEALGVDGSDHEEVDGVGAQAPHGEQGALHVVGHCLPAVAHRLTAMRTTWEIIN